MFKSLAILALLLIVHVNSLGQIARELIGKYQMEVQGGDVLELRSDGTASVAVEQRERDALEARKPPLVG